MKRKKVVGWIMGIALLGLSAGADVIALYGFDEGSGTVLNDLSGNDLDGVLSATTTWTTGKYGGAAEFNAGNDLITIADDNLLDLSSDYTIEAWVYLTAAQGNYARVFEKAGSYATMSKGGDGNGPYGQSVIGGSSKTPDFDLPQMSWMHVALIYDSTAETLSVYTNGALAVAESASGSVSVTTDDFAIGNRTSSSRAMTGYVDELRISDEALSVAELGYNGSLVPEPGTMGLVIVASGVCLFLRRRMHL